MVVRSSSFVKEDLSSPLDSEQAFIKSLSIDSVVRQSDNAVLSNDGILRGERQEVTPHTRYEYKQSAQQDMDDLLMRYGHDHHSNEEFYKLDEEDPCIVEFAERFRIPDGYVGIITPRDELLQIGVSLEASVVKPGQESASALLSTINKTALLSTNSVPAELVVVEAAGE